MTMYSPGNPAPVSHETTLAVKRALNPAWLEAGQVVEEAVIEPATTTQRQTVAEPKPFVGRVGRGPNVGRSKSGVTWQDHEDNCLRENYIKMEAYWCAEELGRSVAAVRCHAGLLGIARYRSPSPVDGQDEITTDAH